MLSFRGFFLFAAFLMASGFVPAHAEYRVFQLTITDGKTGQSRVVLSTLDHIQYPQYHAVNTTDTIAIQATWRCWGRSDWFKGYCPNPNRPSSVSTQPTASSATASR
jgi:hypothetical protein